MPAASSRAAPPPTSTTARGIPTRWHCCARCLVSTVRGSRGLRRGTAAAAAGGRPAFRSLLPQRRDRERGGGAGEAASARDQCGCILITSSRGADEIWIVVAGGRCRDHRAWSRGLSGNAVGGGGACQAGRNPYLCDPGGRAA